MTNAAPPQLQPSLDLVRRLRSSEPLPACPFDRISPHYLTMPDDKPCPFCGQENTLEGPDKCRGADTRIFGEAADRIEELEAALEQFRNYAEGWPKSVREISGTIDLDLIRAALPQSSGVARTEK